MHRILVCITINSHSLDPKLLGRPDDSAGDLSSIGDQNLVEESKLALCRGGAVPQQ